MVKFNLAGIDRAEQPLKPKKSINKLFSQYNINLGPDVVAQMSTYKDMMTAFGEQIFNEFIDADKNGEATLDEIELVSFTLMESLTLF